MYYIEIMENAAKLSQTDVSGVMKAALDKEKSRFAFPVFLKMVLLHDPVITC